MTVYAFSIENFRRSEDEVNALLQLAKEKFEVDTYSLTIAALIIEICNRLWLTRQTNLQSMV